MSLPNHLAIIPDGNRRWAKAQGLFPWQGHEEGVRCFWDLAQASAKLGIKYLTFWAGSYSNLAKRSKEEVNVLFKLMAEELSRPDLLKKLTENETSLRIIGEWEDFTSDETLKEALLDIEGKTKHFTNHQVIILFGYDGQREMLKAQQLLRDSGEEITAENLHRNLLTNCLPEVDLVIRTGGEPHWSAGFLMWQTANSQLYFTEDLWPEFKVPELKKALEDFERRERRLGK